MEWAERRNKIKTAEKKRLRTQRLFISLVKQPLSLLHYYVLELLQSLQIGPMLFNIAFRYDYNHIR